MNIHYYKHSYIYSTPLISLLKPDPCMHGRVSRQAYIRICT